MYSEGRAKHERWVSEREYENEDASRIVLAEEAVERSHELGLERGGHVGVAVRARAQEAVDLVEKDDAGREFVGEREDGGDELVGFACPQLAGIDSRNRAFFNVERERVVARRVSRRVTIDGARTRGVRGLRGELEKD